jgi:hypothetical protein
MFGQARQTDLDSPHIFYIKKHQTDIGTKNINKAMSFAGPTGIGRNAPANYSDTLVILQCLSTYLYNVTWKIE